MDEQIYQSTTSKYNYEMAIQDLQGSGCLSLANIEQLSYLDIHDLFEEIKRWSVYGNHDPKKLRISLNTTNH
jgi:hypothetical protein